jgi:hypothetical protein
MFEPNVEKLIKPIRIEKPQEEFLLPGSSPQEQTELPAPILRETPLEPVATMLQELTSEAGRVQDLMDLLVETTPDIEVSIPEEDHALLGAQTVTTKEYVASAGDNSPDAVRKRHHFEWGLLQGCGATSSPHWPILGLPDLHSIQGDLMDAASVVEGAIFQQTPVQPKSLPEWQADAGASHLAAVNQSLIDGSKSYRMKLAQSTFTMRVNATELLAGMMQPMLDAEAKKMRPVILELMNAMKVLRNLLCHAGLLRALEYRSVRDALLAALEGVLLKQLLSALLVILGKAENTLIRPVLNLFEHDLGNGSLIDRLGDKAAREIAAVAGSTMLSLKRRYNDQAADLIRSIEAKNQQRLLKLHVLGERNLINRWVEHLDTGILILRRALSQNTTLSRTLARSAAKQILQRLEPPPHPLLARLDQHPELSVAQGTRLFNREFAPTPLTSFDSQVRGSFGGLQLHPTDFHNAGEDAAPSPSFTGVDLSGQQSVMSET